MNIEIAAEDTKHGFTLGELYQAVQRISEAGADPRSTVKVNVGLRGQIQKIRVEAPK